MNICNLKLCNFPAFPSLFRSVRSVILVATSKDNHKSSFFVIGLLIFRLVAIIQHPKVFSYIQGRCTLPRSSSCNIHPQSSPPSAECFRSVRYHKSAFRNQVSWCRTEIPRNSLLLRFTEVCVIKTKLIHYLSSVYFVNQSLHVSGIFEAPSSGGILYTYNNWYVLCFSVDCLLAGQQTVN